MSLDNLDYYRRRALEERELAAKSETPEAANAHLELARLYEGLVARADMLPKSHGPVANQNEPDRASLN